MTQYFKNTFWNLPVWITQVKIVFLQNYQGLKSHEYFILHNCVIPEMFDLKKKNKKPTPCFECTRVPLFIGASRWVSFEIIFANRHLLYYPISNVIMSWVVTLLLPGNFWQLKWNSPIYRIYYKIRAQVTRDTLGSQRMLNIY